VGATKPQPIHLVCASFTPDHGSELWPSHVRAHCDEEEEACDFFAFYFHYAPLQWRAQLCSFCIQLNTQIFWQKILYI